MTALPVSVDTRRPRQANAFAVHGIDHLSASSLNQWIAAPAHWIMERLIGRKGPIGCAAYRGTAVEFGVSVGLFDPEARPADCAALAMQKYLGLSARSDDPKREAEGALVLAMTVQGLLALRSLGAPTKPPGHQHRVDVALDGVSVPAIGFLDWWWEEPNFTADLKTTMRVPSSWSDSHRRQASLYQHASKNGGVGFFYCSDKKFNRLDLGREDYAAGLQELTHAARRLERFLGLSRDPYELAELVTPDYGSFYWSNEQTRDLGRRTFGF